MRTKEKVEGGKRSSALPEPSTRVAYESRESSAVARDRRCLSARRHQWHSSSNGMPQCNRLDHHPIRSVESSMVRQSKSSGTVTSFSTFSLHTLYYVLVVVTYYYGDQCQWTRGILRGGTHALARTPVSKEFWRLLISRLLLRRSALTLWNVVTMSVFLDNNIGRRLSI